MNFFKKIFVFLRNRKMKRLLYSIFESADCDLDEIEDYILHRDVNQINLSGCDFYESFEKHVLRNVKPKDFKLFLEVLENELLIRNMNRRLENQVKESMKEKLLDAFKK